MFKCVGFLRIVSFFCFTAPRRGGKGFTPPPPSLGFITAHHAMIALSLLQQIMIAFSLLQQIVLFVSISYREKMSHNSNCFFWN